MKHNYNDNDDFYKEDKRASNNMSQSRRNINQVNFGLQKQKKETKEEERFLSLQLIPQEKDLVVGINGFEETGPEYLMPRQKSFFFFGRE